MQKNPETQQEAGIIPENDEMSEAELDEVDGGSKYGGSKLSDALSSEQQRLQQQMERRSKAYETLSNVLHKNSSAGDIITQNIK